MLPAPTSPLGKSTGEPQASSPGQPVLSIPSLTCGKHSLKRTDPAAKTRSNREITLAVSSQRSTKMGVLRHTVQGQGVAGSYL